MYELVFQPLDVPFGALFLVILVAGVATYWWARKAAKHPEYAAAKEASVDAVLQRLIDMKATPDVVDTALAKLRDVELATLGASVYAEGKDVAGILEAHAKVLLDQAKKLRGQ